MTGGSEQGRWPSKIFGALGPVDRWPPQLTGDVEIMFIQPKIPRQGRISSSINYFAEQKIPPLLMKLNLCVLLFHHYLLLLLLFLLDLAFEETDTKMTVPQAKISFLPHLPSQFRCIFNGLGNSTTLKVSNLSPRAAKRPPKLTNLRDDAPQSPSSQEDTYSTRAHGLSPNSWVWSYVSVKMQLSGHLFIYFHAGLKIVLHQLERKVWCSLT